MSWPSSTTSAGVQRSISDEAPQHVAATEVREVGEGNTLHEATPGTGFTNFASACWRKTS